MVDTQPVTDFAWYFDRAAGIARGEGYSVDGRPTAYWPVGWPALLGAAFKLFGPSLAVAKGINLALGVAACALTAGAAVRLGMRPLAGLAAGLLVAAYPPLWAYATVLASEPTVMVAGLAGLCLLAPDGPPARNLAAGAAFGLAVLARPQALLFAVAAVAVLWAFEGRGRWAAVAAAGLALVVAPWTARNWAVMGAPVPVSTNGGDNLLIGHAPGATGGYRNPLAIEPRLAGLSEVQRDRSAARLGLGYLRRDPGRSLRLVPAKLYETFLKQTDAAYWAFQTRRGELVDPGMAGHRAGFLAYRDAARAGGWALLALALAGTAAQARARRGPAFWLGLAWVGAAAFVACAFFGNGRFGLPAVPFLAVLAAGLIPGRRSS